MGTLSYKTISANKATVSKQWVLVDTDEQTLGRLTSKVAKLLRGKYKPEYIPHVDCGGNVIAVNAEKINLTGNRWGDKTYLRHTGYPGGQRTIGVKDLLARHPERIIEKTIKGMLPKTRLGAAVLRNLKVYVGTEHEHEAQQPTATNLSDLKQWM